MQNAIVRIKGRNTVEILKSLTDIENIAVNHSIKRLVSKKDRMVSNSIADSNINEFDSGDLSNYGLGAFIEEKEFCSVCKNHMILAKNAKGKVYLKCSNKNCKEIKYLTVNQINYYINSHNIKCPKKDGGELKGGLSRYGLYVRCSCGHFLKPDEI